MARTEGSKGQPGVAKSSGDAEVKAVDEILKAYEAEPTTELELELMRSAAPKSKAAVACVTRIIYPVSQLLEWLHDSCEVLPPPKPSMTSHATETVKKKVKQTKATKKIAKQTKTQATAKGTLKNKRETSKKTKTSSSKSKTPDADLQAV